MRKIIYEANFSSPSPHECSENKTVKLNCTLFPSFLTQPHPVYFSILLCWLSSSYLSQWWCILKSANLLFALSFNVLFNTPEVARQKTAGLDQCIQCSKLLSRKLCSFCNRQAHIVQKQKEGLVCFRLQIRVCSLGSDRLCGVKFHWNFHGLWVRMRPHTFHIHESIIVIIYSIMSSCSLLQVQSFLFKLEYWESPTSSPWRLIIKQSKSTVEDHFHPHR